MRKRRVALILAIAFLLATGMALIPEPTPAEQGCYEGILVWDWTYWEWRCSLSTGGGQVCILCFDEIDAGRPWEQEPPP